MLSDKHIHTSDRDVQLSLMSVQTEIERVDCDYVQDVQQCDCLFEHENCAFEEDEESVHKAHSEYQFKLLRERSEDVNRDCGLALNHGCACVQGGNCELRHNNCVFEDHEYQNDSPVHIKIGEDWKGDEEEYFSSSHQQVVTYHTEDNNISIQDD